MPNLYIIAGPNGAGKTTASFTIFPDILKCRIFVNADEIARGLSPFEPEKVAIESGKIMLKRIHGLLKEKKDFGFETTLAGVSHLKFINEAKQEGYFISLIYLWLNSTELAIKRVVERVNSGGHDIPVETIKRRYHSGIKNLFELYIPLTDHWLIIDNSENPFKQIAEGFRNQRILIFQEQIFHKMKNV